MHLPSDSQIVMLASRETMVRLSRVSVIHLMLLLFAALLSVRQRAFS